MADLIGIVLTGVIPLIGGIALLIMGKIKGSSFWAGVLAYIISMIGLVIVSAVMSAALLDMMQTNPIMFTAISTVITCVCMGLALAVCAGACLKNRTFKGAISCGAGFGTGYSVTTAIGLISTYAMAAMINSNDFDKTYEAAVDMGAITKEQLYEMKAQFIDLTIPDVILQIAVTIALAVVLAACTVFIVRGKCSKNLALGIISSVIIISIDGVASMIPNVIAASVISLAIAAAAMFFAFRMKDQIAEEQKPAVPDSFLKSVENSRSDDSSEE